MLLPELLGRSSDSSRVQEYGRALVAGKAYKSSYTGFIE